jgi:CheY-like chemotaxis protein
MKTEAYQLLGDQPHHEEGDPLGFSAVARELKTLILRSRGATPFAIGIEASWGRGKSSLMGQLKRVLAEKPDASDGSEPPTEIRQVAFNAWTAEGSDVLEGLVKSVLNEMDRNILRKSLRNQRLVSYLRVPFLFVAGLLRIDRIADEVWDRLSVDAHRRNEINKLVTRAMEDWRDSAMKKTGKGSKDRLIVISIDDLDRCSPENVLKICEAVKVYLEAPGFVFIIGYDRDVIDDAIQNQKTYSNEITGLAYIEKIIQTVFRVPPPTEKQVHDLLGQFLEDSGTEEIFDPSARKLLIDRNSRNPRRIKRFINRFILEYRLDETSGDYQAELLIKLLIIETYFPRFSNRLYDPSSENPIQEFLDFAHTRDALRRRNLDDRSNAVLDAYGVASGDDNRTLDVLLKELEDQVPETFVDLISDRDFTSLIQTLSDPDVQASLLAKVRRRKELNRQVPSQEASTEVKGGPSSRTGRITVNFAGDHVLWIDDNPDNNLGLIEWLGERGATVASARNGEEALAAMVPRLALVISDIDRENDPDAGFKDLKLLRDSGGYRGPVIFYTSSITRSRRARAQALGAEITETPEELQSLAIRLIESSRHSGAPWSVSS